MNLTQNPVAMRSKKAIIKALLKLMKEMPYEEITVKQILLESKLTRKTFYRNFDNKKDVLDSYIDSIIFEYLSEVLRNNACKNSHFLFEIIVSFLEQYKEVVSILWQNGLEHLLLNQLNTHILSIHRMHRESSTDSVLSGEMSDYLCVFNIGGIWNIVNMWIRTGMKEPMEDIIKTIEM
ncbi:MAG: Transcriptional regulator, AcrR family [Defluviitaleaceae bacterium]|jgi:AcrR family transcriptional regulator|nr:Transcriptional regulator, AcrR family [Defluviitaleaceae bacterium]